MILLIMAVGLTGCGLGLNSAAAQPTATAGTSISLTNWPTPIPASPVPSPTPFPLVTLAPTSTPTPRPTATPSAATTGLTPATTAEQMLAQASTAGGGLSPVTVALVTGNELTIRQGPGQKYGALGTVQAGDLAAVFGTNQAGDWLYVLTMSEIQGWVPAQAMRVLGSLAQAPVLPAHPLAVASASPAPTAQPVKLTPVARAQVKPNGLNVRQGPGVSYTRLLTLKQKEQVSLLALNPRRDWALIETSGGQRGWVDLTYLTVSRETLADAPEVSPSILTESGTTAKHPVVEAAANSSSQANALPAVQPAAVVTNLAPVATAYTTANEVAVRPQPGDGYAAIDTIKDNQEKIEVLALDPTQQWALVQPASSHTGWVSLSNLAVQGSLTKAPQVITAWVDSNAIEARSGPGIYDGVVGNLAINSLLLVSGLDESHSWALVEPLSGGGSGWVPIQFLSMSEPLAQIPLAPTSPVSALAAATDQSAPPSTLSQPAGPSKLVIQQASGGDIMVINPDGTGLRRLTSGIDPVLSPDGQTVAFTRWQGESGSLWLINIDGSHERQLLGFTKQAKGPAWSPDGSQIVLNYQHEGELNPETHCTNLTNHKSPRPPRQAYDVGLKLKGAEPYLCWTMPPDPHWGLRVVNVADGTFQDLDGGTYAFRPTWDPSQNWRIVDDGGMGLVAVDRNRNQPQPLTDDLQDGSPVFSPDGRYLALTAGQPGGSQGYNIYRLNQDGSGRVRLTETPLWVPVVPGDFKQWNNVSPAWSPDSSQIAFLTDRTGRWEIWLMNVDGSNQHPMFSDAINDQLQLSYNFVDERVLSWR